MSSLRSVRFTSGLVLAASVALAACANDDTQMTRRGGPLPSDGGADQGVGGASGEAIKWCDALAVIEAKCQRCHEEPLQNGAPMPLSTYEETQGPWSSTENVGDRMLDVVRRGIMPYVALNDSDDPIMPPVEPLTRAEKATLIGWLEQGQLPEGGTDCP